MDFDKKTRFGIGSVLLVILIFVPLKIEIGYMGMYYAVLALLAIWGAIHFFGEKRIEERFFRNWERKKAKPKVRVILIEAIKAFVYMLGLVVFGQIIVDGREPHELLQNMPFGAQIGVLAMLAGFGLIVGFMNFFEKNRRYDRLYGKFYK